MIQTAVFHPLVDPSMSDLKSEAKNNTTFISVPRLPVLDFERMWKKIVKGEKKSARGEKEVKENCSKTAHAEVAHKCSSKSQDLGNRIPHLPPWSFETFSLRPKAESSGLHCHLQATIGTSHWKCSVHHVSNWVFMPSCEHFSLAFNLLFCRNLKRYPTTHISTCLH